MIRRAFRALPVCLLLACLFPGPGAGEEAKLKEYSAARFFGGPIRAETAEYAARVAASNLAVQEAMRLLAALPEVRFAGAVTPGNPKPPDVAGLACLLYEVRPVRTALLGYPPQLRMEARVALVPPEQPGRAVIDALTRPDTLDAASRLQARREALLDAYDRAAAPLLRTPPGMGGSAGLLEAERCVNALKSLDFFFTLLPQYGDFWPDPAAALEKLNACLALDPHNALALAARAEVMLKLDKPDAAMDDAQAALALDDTLDRAHDALGTALLVRRLPALAVNSFGKAAALCPRKPSYLLNRASAYLMLDEKEAMCRDLAAACGLGDCAGLTWAGKNGMCPKTSEGVAPDTVPQREGE